MNKYFIGIFGGVLVVVGLGFLAGYNFNKPVETLGSVARAGEYQATTTSYLAVPTGAVITGPGTLGSVIITGVGAGLMEIFDATTTNANLRAASQTTSSIFVASFPASTAVGTYTFDKVLFNGLIITTATVRPTSTITWR